MCCTWSQPTLFSWLMLIESCLTLSVRGWRDNVLHLVGDAGLLHESSSLTYGFMEG